MGILRIDEYRKLPAERGLEEELAALHAGAETLLLWEALSICAVLPRSGSAESDLVAPVPMLRRASGGGAVLIGPGCLNYALVLSLDDRPALLDVAQSYQAILRALLACLTIPGARILGSDLVLGDRKFAGHAQRRTRRTLLHHGTILYDFDLGCITRFLREPARQPAYRRGRSHRDFLVNAPVPLEGLLAGFRDFVASSFHE